jgi:hypothetical protein
MNRLFPPEFVDAPGAHRAFVEKAIDEQPHTHRSGVPSRRGKRTEDRLVSGLFVEVKRLWVVLFGELEDIVFRYLITAVQFVHVSDFEVFVIADHHPTIIVGA